MNPDYNDEITDVNLRVDDVKVYEYALEKERARHAQTRLDCDLESERAEAYKRALADAYQENVDNVHVINRAIAARNAAITIAVWVALVAALITTAVLS